jgi:transcription elongation factor SPT6
MAINYLSKEDNGEFYFRPSSRGTDHLTLTWKFYESNIVHIDITEYEKAIGANIGSKLRISDETYENLQEIVERYITPCNRSLREVTQHPKFLRCQNLEELQKTVEQEKEEDASRIPYKFTVLDKYPQYIIMAYIPKKELVREFIKVKPRGYFFHHQYHYPFQNMINWFKQEFRSREYQRYLRKTGSPQLLAG